MLPLVYVAGPISLDPLTHAREAIILSNRMMTDGYVLPFAPQLSVLHQLVQPRSWEDWLVYDEGIIQHCDALYRIAGESKGADREEAFVNAGRGGLGPIPIFYSLDSLYVWAQKWAVYHALARANAIAPKAARKRVGL